MATSTRQAQLMHAAARLRFGELWADPVSLLRMAIDPLVAVGMLVATMFWFDAPFDQHYLVLAFLVSLTFSGRREAIEGSSGGAQTVLLHWLLVVGLLWLLGWASQTLGYFDPRVLITWVLATPVALVASHEWTPRLLERAIELGGVQRSAVIVGVNETGRRLAKRIDANPCLGTRLVGFFDDRGPERLGRLAGRRVLGRLEDVAEFAKKQHVDVIYIALPMCPQPRLFGVLEALRDTTASVYFVPDVFLFDLIQARFGSVDGVPVLSVCESPYLGINRVVKRASDLVLATAALVLSAPLLLAIAIGVKLTSPGPVLFKQRRYGLDGREILVYKFRTMKCVEDGEEIRQATRNDPRTTPFGAFLRRYSLDELPQFINVLQGRMSVVGPRPHAVAHNEMYRKLIPGYMLRHKVKPGITGLAQVNGLRGETETVEKMQARIECDIEYLRAWSLQLDLRIVARTISVVLGREGAW